MRRGFALILFAVAVGSLTPAAFAQYPYPYPYPPAPMYGPMPVQYAQPPMYGQMPYGQMPYGQMPMMPPPGYYPQQQKSQQPPPGPKVFVALRRVDGCRTPGLPAAEPAEPGAAA